MMYFQESEKQKLIQRFFRDKQQQIVETEVIDQKKYIKKLMKDIEKSRQEQAHMQQILMRDASLVRNYSLGINHNEILTEEMCSGQGEIPEFGYALLNQFEIDTKENRKFSKYLNPNVALVDYIDLKNTTRDKFLEKASRITKNFCFAYNFVLQYQQKIDYYQLMSFDEDNKDSQGDSDQNIKDRQIVKMLEQLRDSILDYQVSNVSRPDFEQIRVDMQRQKETIDQTVMVNKQYDELFNTINAEVVELQKEAQKVQNEQSNILNQIVHEVNALQTENLRYNYLESQVRNHEEKYQKWLSYNLQMEKSTQDCSEFTDMHKCYDQGQCGWCQFDLRCSGGNIFGPTDISCINYSYSQEVTQYPLDQQFEEIKSQLRKIMAYDIDFKIEYIFASDKFEDSGLYTPIDDIFEEVMRKHVYQIENY